jgi:acetyl-CoA synthetase
LVALGIPPSHARRVAARFREAVHRHPAASDPEEQVRLWTELRDLILGDPSLRERFGLHRLAYRIAYADRRPMDGPGPAWLPSPADIRRSNLAELMGDRHVATYADLHAWSVRDREAFWDEIVRRLGIVFRTSPNRILDPDSDPQRPAWLPGARLNIAESCFRADPGRVAIVSASEAAPGLRRITYGELRRLAARVSHGLDRFGVPRDGRVALYLPMTPESVAIYLGIVQSGRRAVGLADASAPLDVEKRVRISGTEAVFTIDAYVRDGKEQRIYAKAVAGGAPRAVVLPSDGGARTRILRDGDVEWAEFLAEEDSFDPVPCDPGDPTNILFSSGTTKDPKAIVWTHTTPIKAAADGYLHHDVHPDDVLTWPTSFGWMMGPWLTYATLVNRATIALYVGAPNRRGFGEFVARSGVTMLGVVPKLVRTWLADGSMEGLDWSRVRRFSSTGEASTPDEMLYLMSLAGYKPIIEYCGGTEIGGGYITGTVVQPCAPSTFTTPALGIDFTILDEGRPADLGEVFLIPPSIGLSTDLLNYDHGAEYFEGLPRGPHGEILRRHGDQIERLGGGFYRHHGRIDDMININGVKTSAEEIRQAILHDSVYDAKPFAVDVDGSGQHRLVVYAVPKDRLQLESDDLPARLRTEFQKAIKERLNPLLAHVHEVVLVSELPQAGPGKTLTMRELGRDYLARQGRA